MSDVYRFRCPDGQEHAWHGTLAALRKEHPDCLITGRLMVNETDKAAGVEQGYWVPYLGRQTDEKPAVADAPVEVAVVLDEPKQKVVK